jgi:16S rRNA (cytosine1402-N4)-methyltransferase
LGVRVVLRLANFESIYDTATAAGIVPLDAVLFDLGLSSYQLADPRRGFSFAADAPPDMRFDETSGVSALELIDRSSERELAGILATFGEERRAGRIAKAIVAARAEGRLMTSAELAAIVASVAPNRRGSADAGRIHPATRTFQALRIAVNREVEVLSAGLAGALAALRPGGRLAVISYHSLEDRIVKRFIARESRDCIEDPPPPVCTCGHRAQLRAVTKGVITAGTDEVRRNRRARSAKLRVAEKLAAGWAQERRVS